MPAQKNIKGPVQKLFLLGACNFRLCWMCEHICFCLQIIQFGNMTCYGIQVYILSYIGPVICLMPFYVMKNTNQMIFTYRKESGVGAGIDSYYEYLLKGYIFLGDETFLERFNTHYMVSSNYSRSYLTLL